MPEKGLTESESRKFYGELACRGQWSREQSRWFRGASRGRQGQEPCPVGLVLTKE